MQFKSTKSLENPMAPQGLLSRKQVAHLFGVCKETVRRWERQGMFTPVIINSRVLRYRMADVQSIVGQN